MLKLDPHHILYMYEHTSSKAQVEEYVNMVTSSFNNTIVNPDWFRNNGETLGESIHQWLCDRGMDVQDFETELDECAIGVAMNGDVVGE